MIDNDPQCRVWATFTFSGSKNLQLVPVSGTKQLCRRRGHPSLPSNESGCLHDNLAMKLEGYNQLEDRIVEHADEAPKEREFYIPHELVVRESKWTKWKITLESCFRKSQLNQPALENFSVSPLHFWLDSRAAVLLIRGSGSSKMFVTKRVETPRQHQDEELYYVPLTKILQTL